MSTSRVESFPRCYRPIVYTSYLTLILSIFGLVLNIIGQNFDHPALANFGMTFFYASFTVVIALSIVITIYFIILVARKFCRKNSHNNYAELASNQA